MATVARHLTELVRRAAEAAGHGDSPVPLEPCVPTNNPEHGDYQSNFAFRLGKALRTNPRQVAQAIVDALPDDPAVASAEVAGPGFVNFRLDTAWIGADVARRANDPHLGGSRPGDGRTLVIDYSSPNIAKRMHVGHLRSTIIGNALHRMHAFLGWSVVADNHVGDWGTQFGKLIVAWHQWRDEAAYAADPIGELQRLYQRFGEEAKGDPALVDRARAATVKLQEGEPGHIALWQQFVDVSMREFDGLYARLGVVFDVVHGESFYRDSLQALVDDLLEQGIATINEGAAIVPFGDDDGKGLGNTPLLVRKSDGAALYGTTDLATLQHRMRTWRPERIVYVTDVRQQLHFRQVFAAARKMGVTDPELVHVWFGMLKFPGGAIASTRAGQVLNLVDVLDAAAAKALEVVKDKSPELDEAAQQEIAEAVGVGAIKYNDLSQNPQSDIVFDLERSLSLEGNTAPYLMYAYARCCSILRKAEVSEDHKAGAISPDHPAERALALLVARTPELVEAAAETYRPNLLADHLYGIAQAYGPFYEQCPVLKGDVPDAVRSSRLSLVIATARALEVGLSLLGLRAIPRM